MSRDPSVDEQLETSMGKSMRKPYTPKMPATWWLRRRAYFLFIVREVTSVFVAIYCVILLVGLCRLKEGGDAFESFLVSLRSPFSIGFHVVALLFAGYHSITWFNLTPKAMVIRIGEEKVPPLLIAGSNYVAWLVLSAALIWIVLKG